MKRLNFLAATSFAIFLILQVFPSCECQTVECNPGYFAVQFLSKNDGSDLFKNGTYQRDSLKLFVMHPSVTSDYSHQLHNWQNDPSFEQQPLTINVDRGVSGYIFQFNSAERDTLNISYTVIGGGDCCLGEVLVTFGLFKGDTIFPDASGSLILKK